MKKTLSFLLLWILAFHAIAQNNAITSITISLPNNPNANTANWTTGTSLLTISANAKMDNGRVATDAEGAKILVFVRKNGVRICGTFNTGTAPTAGFATATKVWSGTQAISLIGQTCTLLPGNYELVVQFFGNKNGATIAVSAEKTKLFTIPSTVTQQNQPPQNLSPLNANIFTQAALTAPIIFKWTPILPAQGAPSTYRLKIWQLMVGQSNSQAMAANQPLVTKDVNLATQTVISNLVSGPCVAPYRCEFVWIVQALDPNGNPVTGTNGTSSPTTFSGATTVTSSTASVGDTIRAGLNGEFLIAVNQITTETDGSLSGKGTVTVNWLSTNIAVEFSKIRIDVNKRLTAGGIITEKSTGVNYLQAWLISNATAVAATIPLDGIVNWTNNQVTNLVDWANNHNSSLPNFNYQSNIAAPPIPPNSLKMPFGIKFNNLDDQLMITEIIFKPNVAKINFLVQKKFTKGVNDYKLGFSGKYFEIHPKKIDFSNGRVDLVEDITVPSLASDPKMKFTFKKGALTNGCYLEWDSTGVKNVGLALDVKFTRDWLLPIPTAPDSVKATISGNGTSLHDILLTGNLPNCEIVGTNGLKLLVDSIAMDLSNTRNPSAMHFPTNYTNDTTAVGKLLWQGFYIKKVLLSLPDTWKTGANPTQIIANNIIIDDYGVTMKAKATNVITFPQGRVSDMSASLDTLEIAMLKGSLTNGYAKGKLVLPISDETLTNTLKYKATFAQVGGANSFQIVIVPSGPIDADILKGKITLNPTSNITANLSANVKSMAINLNGSFDWGDKDLSVTDTTASTGGSAPVRKKGIKGLKMEMTFQNLSIGYTNNSTTNTNTMTFNPGSWSFASPQKRLANFPVSIKNVHYKSLPTVAGSDPNLKELVRGALMIDIVANLTDDIGGSTTVGGAFAIQMNKSAKKFIPKFKGVFIEDIAVHADMPAVKIDGKLKMYDNDPVYGDGFLANIGVTFTAVSLQVNALVQFGNTVYQNNNQYYRYWRAEADAKFQPGIPFLTGVGFYGFGGGAFYNMNANLVQRSSPEVGFKYEFTPKKSSLGFKVMATIGTLPKFETFNADVGLLAQFTSSGGITKIGFTGDFWLAAKLEERIDSKIKGGVVAEYNFTDKIFYMAALLSVKVPPAIETTPSVGFVMNINGSTNKWYFKAGTPKVTNSIKILGMDLYSYFMFGNDLGTDIPHGFTTGFVNNYNSTFPGHPITNTGDGGASLTATGMGIAFGVGVKFDRNLSTSLPSGTIRNWDFNFKLSAGAELNAALLQYSGSCGGYNPVGINGYRASGSVGFYAQMTGSLDGMVKNRNNKITQATSLYYWNDKHYNICDIRAGGWLIGAFPKPYYFAGAVDGKVGLFDDLVNINFHKDFSYGEADCGTMPQVSAPVVTDTVDKVSEFKNKLIQSVEPNTRYNFPITSPINVRYALVPERSFDIAESQGDGTIKNRTFKMVVVRSLEVKNTAGAWVPVTIFSKVNNLGEYQYYIKPPIGGAATTVITSVANIMVLNINTGNTLLAPNGLFKTTSIPNPIPPPPAPNYPNPVPDVVNQLEIDKDYRFKVTATLMEYGMNPTVGANAGRGDGLSLSWAPAKTRAGLVVTETKTLLFKTGPMTAVIVAAGASGPIQNKKL